MFEDVAGIPLEARAGSAIYSDDPTQEVQVRAGQGYVPPTPLSGIPAPTANGSLFLAKDDEWFAKLRNVRFV